MIWIFPRPPPFGKLRTGFDRLRANGKIVKLMALKPELGNQPSLDAGFRHPKPE